MIVVYERVRGVLYSILSLNFCFALRNPFRTMPTIVERNCSFD